MVNYQKGKIYKLVSLVSDKIYVGSTCQKLCVRYAGHKRDSIKAPNRTVYKHINQIGWDNYSIILIENSPCNNKEELERKERYYIEMLHSELNYNIPTRTKVEYRETHKQTIQQMKKEYYENNKEKIKCSIKQYKQDNKQQISEHKKQYRERNKEKIRFKKSIYCLKQKFKKLIIDCNDISKEHDELINKFTLIH